MIVSSKTFQGIEFDFVLNRHIYTIIFQLLCIKPTFRFEIFKLPVVISENELNRICFELPGLLESLSALTGTGASLKTGLPPLKNKSSE